GSKARPIAARGPYFVGSTEIICCPEITPVLSFTEYRSMTPSKRSAYSFLSGPNVSEVYFLPWVPGMGTFVNIAVSVPEVSGSWASVVKLAVYGTKAAPLYDLTASVI